MIGKDASSIVSENYGGAQEVIEWKKFAMNFCAHMAVILVLAPHVPGVELPDLALGLRDDEELGDAEASEGGIIDLVTMSCSKSHVYGCFSLRLTVYFIAPNPLVTRTISER